MLRLALIVVLSVTLASCSRDETGCTAGATQSTMISLIKERLEKLIRQEVDKAETGSISTAKIRASLAQLTIGIDDIRTTKEDPNSSKRFCAGTLKISFPSETLESAEKALEAIGSENLSALADSRGVERNANSFTSDLEFEVQPTDAGDKVFAETPTDNLMFAFATDVVAASLLSNAVEQERRQRVAAAKDAERQESEALAEQQQANLTSAKAENQLAMQTVNATWAALSRDMRQRLLPLQRAWVRKKDADCRVEAASAATTGPDIEVTRLNCDTRMTAERVAWLNQYRTADVEPVADAPDEEME